MWVDVSVFVVVIIVIIIVVIVVMIVVVVIVEPMAVAVSTVHKPYRHNHDAASNQEQELEPLFEAPRKLILEDLRATHIDERARTQRVQHWRGQRTG